MLTKSKLKFGFTTTLQILTRNKNQLKIINKDHYISAVAKAGNQHLLPCMNMNYEYIRSTHLKFSNNFPQLDVFKNKLQPNAALANGEDYQEYSLPKILHICLRLIKQGNEEKKKWNQIEKRTKFLFRNTSAIDNILLLYISIHRFQINFQDQVIRLLEAEQKSFTQMERQLLFYTICHLKDNLATNPHLARLNKLKDNLSLSMQKSKLTLGNLIQWIILVSITNATNPMILMKNLQKVHLYSKYILTPQQFISLMKCIYYRSTISNYTLNQQLETKGKQLIQLFKSTVTNHQMLLNSVPDKIRLKMYLSYYYPGSTEHMLTSQQIMSPILSPAQSLRYIYWLWKNQYMQLYELKSLYESVQINLNISQEKKISRDFQHIDIVFYICWLEMGLKTYRNYDKVIHIAKNLQYVPQGLQEPVWHYLAEIVKQKVNLNSEQKQSISVIVRKIQKIHQTHNKTKIIHEEIQKLKSRAQITQFSKFLNSIKAWTFKYCQPIGPIDYIGHFVSHQIKIILNCLSKIHQIESSHEINNEYTLSKKLLKSHLGYNLIDINVEQFLKMNYNDRVKELRNQINIVREIKGKISEK